MTALDLSDDKIVETWNALGEKKAVDNWMLLNFVDKTKLQVLEKGQGGLAQLKTQFADDQVMFGILRVGAEDRKEALTSQRQKFMMITWIGPQVGIMKKAKVGPQREELIRILPGLQFFLGASEQEEVDMKHLAAKLLAAGGAHKPTHYIFGEGQEVALTDLSNFKTYV